MYVKLTKMVDDCSNYKYACMLVCACTCTCVVALYVPKCTIIQQTYTCTHKHVGEPVFTNINTCMDTRTDIHV